MRLLGCQAAQDICLIIIISRSMEENMEHYSKSDIVKMVEERMLNLSVFSSRTFWKFKNVAVTTSQLEKVLNNQCVLTAHQ